MRTLCEHQENCSQGYSCTVVTHFFGLRKKQIVFIVNFEFHSVYKGHLQTHFSHTEIMLFCNTTVVH